MIRTRSGKGQAQRHIYAVVEGMEFERNEPLIVIHAEDRVELTPNHAVKEGIR